MKWPCKRRHLPSNWEAHPNWIQLKAYADFPQLFDLMVVEHVDTCSACFSSYQGYLLRGTLDRAEETKGKFVWSFDLAYFMGLLAQFKLNPFGFGFFWKDYSLVVAPTPFGSPTVVLTLAPEVPSWFIQTLGIRLGSEVYNFGRIGECRVDFVAGQAAVMVFDPERFGFILAGGLDAT